MLSSPSVREIQELLRAGYTNNRIVCLLRSEEKCISPQRIKSVRELGDPQTGRPYPIPICVDRDGFPRSYFPEQFATAYRRAGGINELARRMDWSPNLVWSLVHQLGLPTRTCGRPRIPEWKVERLRDLWISGHTTTFAAKDCGISNPTVSKYYQHFAEENPKQAKERTKYHRLSTPIGRLQYRLELAKLKSEQAKDDTSIISREFPKSVRIETIDQG